MNTITADKQQKNKSHKIVNLKEGLLTSKLEEMGLYCGKVIKLVFKAPLGDPIAFNVDGYMLSLRKEEAQLIEVEQA